MHLLLQAALEEGNVSVVPHNEVHTEADHEVLVLVGLPGQPCLVQVLVAFDTGQLNKLLCTAGSGKSTWATRYVANHPEKHYALLSVDGIIKQLKVRLAVPCTAKRKFHSHYQMSFTQQFYIKEGAHCLCILQSTARLEYWSVAAILVKSVTLCLWCIRAAV